MTVEELKLIITAQTEKVQAKIDKLKSSLVDLNNTPSSEIDISTGNASAQLRRLQAEVERTQAKIDKLNAKMASAYAKQDVVASQYTDVPALTGMSQEETVDVMVQGDPQIQALNADISQMESELTPLNMKLAETKEKIAQVGNQSSGAAVKTKSLSDSAKKAGGHFDYVGHMLERMLIRMAILAVLALVFKSITEGIQNMAQGSDTANQTMSSLTTSFLYLKNSIASAVMPVLQALEPIITTIIDGLANLFSMIGMVTSVIFGNASSFVQAKKANVDYAASLKKTASTALASFDQINTINSSGSSGAPSPTQMFEKVTIPQNLISVGQKIRSVFTHMFDGWQLPDVNLDNLSQSLNNLYQSAVPLTEDLWDGLEWAWNNIFVPLGEWVGNELLPAFLDTFSGCLQFLDQVIKDAEPAFQWIWDNMLNPIATFVGGVIVGFLKDLTGAFSGLSSWAGENKQTISDAAVIIIGMLAGIWVYNTVNNIIEFIRGLAKSFHVWAGGISVAGASATIAQVGIGLLLGMILLVSQNWSKMNDLEKVVAILGLITAAAFVAAVAVGAFHSALTLGIAAAAIAAGVIAVTWAVTSAQNTAQANTKQFTKMATGGIVTSPTVAMVGEAGDEAVVPLENNTGWMDKLATAVVNGMSMVLQQNNTSGAQNITVNVGDKRFFDIAIDAIHGEEQRTGINYVNA